MHATYLCTGQYRQLVTVCSRCLLTTDYPPPPPNADGCFLLDPVRASHGLGSTAMLECKAGIVRRVPKNMRAARSLIPDRQSAIGGHDSLVLTGVRIRQMTASGVIDTL